MSIEDAFGQYYRPLCMYALHYLNDVDEAEDVVQECFAVLWERMQEGQEVEEVRPYLYRMVRNRCVEMHRRAIPVDNEVLPSDLEDVLTDEECEERSIDEARMWTAIDGLSPRCREALLLCKRDGLKYEEIARRQGVSVNTVKNQVSKALKAVRDEVHRVYMYFFG